MQTISRAISGESGLGPAFAFLVAGAIVIAFASSLGFYLAAKGASMTSIVLLVFFPLVAGVVHSLAVAVALWRASALRPTLRTLSLTVAGIYCFLQVAALCGGVLLAFALGH